MGVSAAGRTGRSKVMAGVVTCCGVVGSRVPIGADGTGVEWQVVGVLLVSSQAGTAHSVGY